MGSTARLISGVCFARGTGSLHASSDSSRARQETSARTAPSRPATEGARPRRTRAPQPPTSLDESRLRNELRHEARLEPLDPLFRPVPTLLDPAKRRFRHRDLIAVDPDHPRLELLAEQIHALRRA